MSKILYFLMAGLAFTALQVGAAEAAADCSDFAPGTPPFVSCVADNQGAAGGAGMEAKDCSDFTPGTPPFVSCVADNQGAAGGAGMGAPPTTGNSMGAPPTTGNSMGAPATSGADCANAGDPNEVAACWDRQSAEMGAPGTVPMGVEPSLVDRFKGMLGLGTEVPPTGAADGNLEDPCMLVEGPARVACYAAAPGNDGPPIDPRSGQAFTQADEAKFTKYADECEATKGVLSEGSAQELVAEGFTRIQVEKLCKDGPEQGSGDHVSTAAPR